MKPEQLSLLYFSPTATTRIILEEIAGGTGLEVTNTIDITLPANRDRAIPSFSHELVLVGAPVYGGRLPTDAADCFKRLTASRTPAVLVVLYGNRDFDDALLELKDITSDRGFIPVAGAAFIGEHSFCSEEFVIARNRPDDKDLKKARDFGQQISGLLDRYPSVNDIPALTVPGNHPYKTVASRGVIPFLEVTEDCTQCGICVSVCPKDCIDASDNYTTDDAVCIHCCACIKVCPEQARVLKDSPIKDIARWLSENCGKRKEPRTFLPG